MKIPTEGRDPQKKTQKKKREREKKRTIVFWEVLREVIAHLGAEASLPNGDSTWNRKTTFDAKASYRTDGRFLSQ